MSIPYTRELGTHAQCPPTKIAFFSATPQGGGVALMRHALVRFWDQLGVKLNWFVFIPSIAL